MRGASPTNLTASHMNLLRESSASALSSISFNHTADMGNSNGQSMPVHYTTSSKHLQTLADLVDSKKKRTTVPGYQGLKPSH